MSTTSVRENNFLSTLGAHVQKYNVRTTLLLEFDDEGQCEDPTISRFEDIMNGRIGYYQYKRLLDDFN